MILGITGIFGSGKTTVARMFANHGFVQINADEIGHEALKRRGIQKKVVGLFGKGILTLGVIDRKKLKLIVFSDSRRLKQLNALLHPPILRVIKSRITKNPWKQIVIDAPLLLEAGGEKLVDKIVVVTISKKEQMRRLLARGKWTKKEILQISRSQFSQAAKVKRADFVVDNSGKMRETSRIVKAMIGKMILD